MTHTDEFNQSIGERYKIPGFDPAATIVIMAPRFLHELLLEQEHRLVKLHAVEFERNIFMEPFKHVWTTPFGDGIEIIIDKEEPGYRFIDMPVQAV